MMGLTKKQEQYMRRLPEAVMPERVNALLAASTGPIRLRRLNSEWRRRLGRLIGSTEINDADCDLIESAHDIAEEYLAVVVEVARLRAQVDGAERFAQRLAERHYAELAHGLRVEMAAGDEVQERIKQPSQVVYERQFLPGEQVKS